MTKTKRECLINLNRPMFPTGIFVLVLSLGLQVQAAAVSDKGLQRQAGAVFVSTRGVRSGLAMSWDGNL